MGAILERFGAAVRFEPREDLTRLGMIALSSDLTSERDAARLIPWDRAALHVARVANENPATPENLRKMAPRLTEAAALLEAGLGVRAIYYSCTAASVAIGENAVAGAIRASHPGVPVVTPTSAALAAFAALGAARIAVMAPYLEETTEPLLAWFEAQGLRIASARCLGVADDRDIARITPETIVDAALAADAPDADALFLSCTALPALQVIEALEARLGKPVVTSNQASFWRLLHHCGLEAPADAPGRLFRLAPMESAA